MKPFERCIACNIPLHGKGRVDDSYVYCCPNTDCLISFHQTVYPYHETLSFSKLQYFSCKVDDQLVVVDYRFIDDGKVYLKPEFMFGTFIGGVCKGKKVKAITDRIRTWILFS